MNAGSEYEPEVPLSASYFRCPSESVDTWVCFPLQRRVIFGIEVEPPSFLPTTVLIRSWVRELCSFDLLSSQAILAFRELKAGHFSTVKVTRKMISNWEHTARLDHQYMCITFSHRCHSRCPFAAVSHLPSCLWKHQQVPLLCIQRVSSDDQFWSLLRKLPTLRNPLLLQGSPKLRHRIRGRTFMLHPHGVNVSRIPFVMFFLAAQQCLFLHYRTSLILGPSTQHHHLSEKSPQDISKPSFNFKNHHQKLPSSRDFPRFSPDFPHPPRAIQGPPWTFLGSAMIRAPGVNAVLNGLALARQILRRQNAFEEAVIGRRGAGGTVPVDRMGYYSNE